MAFQSKHRELFKIVADWVALHKKDYEAGGLDQDPKRVQPRVSIIIDEHGYLAFVPEGAPLFTNGFEQVGGNIVLCAFNLPFRNWADVLGGSDHCDSDGGTTYPPCVGSPLDWGYSPRKDEGSKPWQPMNRET